MPALETVPDATAAPGLLSFHAATSVAASPAAVASTDPPSGAPRTLWWLDGMLLHFPVVLRDAVISS